VRLMFFGKEFLLSSGARICIKSKSPLPQSFDLLHKTGIYAHFIDSSNHWSYQHILIVTDAFCKIKGMLNLILQVDIKTRLSLQSWKKSLEDFQLVPNEGQKFQIILEEPWILTTFSSTMDINHIQPLQRFRETINSRQNLAQRGAPRHFLEE